MKYLFEGRLDVMTLFAQEITGFFNGDEDDIVLYDVVRDRSFSRRAFAAIVSSWSQELKEKKIFKVLACVDNCAELAIFYFAAMLSGTLVIAVDPEKTEAEKREIQRIHRDAVLYDTDKLKALFSRFISTDQGEIAAAEVHPERPYLITYTSGSTGSPKGVVHTLGNLLAASRAFGDTLHYGTGTVMGHCMPMTYMAGILNTLIMPLVCGGTVVVFDRFSMKSAFSFWANVREHRVNTLWLSPTMLRIVNLMDSRAEMKAYFQSCSMKISIGTAPLDFQLRTDFETKYQTRLYQSYGLSETLFVSTEVIEEGKSKHTVGRLLPGVDVVSAEDGELQIHVPWMMVGYTNADTDAFLDAGRYISGDLGIIEEDGNLSITGRKKELIVRGGYNLNPRDIENLLMGKFHASECMAVPVLSCGEEQIACCYVSDTELNLHEVNGVIAKELGKHYCVDLLEKRKCLPKNLNGKADRKRLCEEMEHRNDLEI